MYHKAYDGPIPITYIDNRLYQGGCTDYIEAFNDDKLIWVLLFRDLLDAHNIPRWKIKTWSCQPANALAMAGPLLAADWLARGSCSVSGVPAADAVLGAY